ncbi:Ligand-binding protein SH3 [Flavobacterium sp. 9AF]|uniref:SH3 domain-containing protein n=1 Tax=Flavobacterium sp. 9AF TaxID=2653142 RepID=UPI0012F20EC9|nr:SH3 domain-containing protein [Flavobacterium sp. 9AF]VXB55103.1 Ligand-binding protein SH3 [Flavobacterium sp. 9AF]
MKNILAYLILILSFSSYSQKKYWIVNDTRLYEKPSLNSNFHGYFKYGASIQVIDDNYSGWVKIKADNNDEGFVEKKDIKTVLNANDIIKTDNENPIIKGNDSYHGGNHLFVLVAGLKLRSEPNSNSKIIKITSTGMPISVSYIPINDEKWVCVDNDKFTLRKFIGNRPDLNNLYTLFNKIEFTNIQERKTISERIVELAWNTGYKHLSKAYTIYYEVVKQIGDSELIEKTKNYILLANGLSNQRPLNEILEITKKSDFIIKNLNVNKFHATYLELEKNYNNPLKIAEIEDDCGIYLNNLFHYYSNMNVSVDKKNNKIEISKIYLDNNTKFKLNKNTILTKETTERDFLSNFGQYIDASIESPNRYTFALEYATLILEFKVGKLFSVEVMNYC